MQTDFLQIKQLGIQLSGNKIIDQMSFNIRKNTLTTFLGPSGSGKTTVLRAIAGLNTNVTGKILLEGQEIQQLSTNQRHIGMVFQSYALFPNMTVFDNVAYGLRVQKKRQAAIQQDVQAMLDKVGLRSKQDKYPDQLSGGQKQRVAIARAMVLKPKLLLLDEPLSALDAKIRVSLRQQIRQYQQELGITMLFVTHDQAEAMAISDDIVVMNEGQVQQQGSPLDIYTQPANVFMAQFIGNHNLLTGEHLKTLGVTHTAGHHPLQAQQSYIIRPEVFGAHRRTDTPMIEIPGQITNRVVLGDRIQYLFQSNTGQALKVEFLNQATPLSAHAVLSLYLNEDDIQPVGAAHAE